MVGSGTLTNSDGSRGSNIFSSTLLITATALFQPVIGHRMDTDLGLGSVN